MPPLLDSQVPLKPGEKHCPFCLGYGRRPIVRDDPQCTHFDHSRCELCEGTGKNIHNY